MKTILLIAVLCGATSAQQHAKPLFESQEAAGDWMMNYYRNPEPQKLAAAFRYFAETKSFKANDENSLPVVFFFAEALQKSPATLEDFQQIDCLKDTDCESALDTAIAFSGVASAPDTLKAIAGSQSEDSQKKISDLFAAPNKNIADLQITTPASLDILWSAFFASGDKLFVERIIDVLPWADEKQNMNKLLLGSAAEWSLSALSQQQSAVFVICKEEVSKRQGRTKELLMKILKPTDKAKP